MGRVREKKRWRKEEKWRERKKRPAPFNPVLHPPLVVNIICYNVLMKEEK
jgi:hypothetical protein